MHPTTRLRPSRRTAPPFRRAVLAATLLLLIAAAPAAAQQPSTESTGGVQLSGVLFTHFRYGGDAGDRSESRFDVERAYLNFRADLGERLGIAVTADVFQQRDTSRAGYYRGWALRAKYAYLQYDVLAGDDAPLGLNGNLRLGLLNTVIIGHEDDYWPRWITETVVDRYDFQSSADAGAAFELESAGGALELYATVTNGEGYQRGEVDRFKDYAARLSVRPFAGLGTWASALVITPWGSLGSRGSRFVDGAGTVAPVGRGLDRNMWGVFTGYRAPALTLGAEIAVRIDATEAADTLGDLEPTFGEETRRVASAFILARPLALLDSASRLPLGIVFRYDRLTSSATPDGHGNTIIAGLTWDLSSRVSLALDYQGETRHDGFDGPDTRTYFLHTVARF